MKFRFRRRVKLLPGVSINLGAKGASLSVGPPGAKVTLGKKGVTTTLGLPGTGVSASKHQPWKTKPLQISTMPQEIREIVEVRPPYWEFILLQKAIGDRIEEMNAAWRRGVSEPMDVQTYCSWGASHMSQLGALINSLKDILEVDSVAAMGPPGRPGDAEKILMVVEDMSALLKEIVVWEQVILVFAEHPIFGHVARKMSGMSQPFADTINKFKKKLDEQLEGVATTKRINIAVEMGNLPNLDDHLTGLESFAKEAFDEGVEGDFFQTDFRLKRGELLLGRFSRRTVLENLSAGLFRADDLYWSEKRLAWRSVRALETEGDLKIPDSPVEKVDD